MATRKKATLRGKWWKNYLKSIRHCYRCGGSLERRYIQIEKVRRLICVKCSTITYINPKVVAGVIPVMPDGRVVLLKRNIEPALGFWTFPAGYQEMGESVQEAAVREVYEESFLRVTVGRLVGIYGYKDAGVVTIVYEGFVPEGQHPKPGIEAQKVQLFTKKTIPWKKLAFRSVADSLRDWAKMK